jgi:hypothetical protein
MVCQTPDQEHRNKHRGGQHGQQYTGAQPHAEPSANPRCLRLPTPRRVKRPAAITASHFRGSAMAASGDHRPSDPLPTTRRSGPTAACLRASRKSATRRPERTTRERDDVERG